jgi:aminomethyltransferase
MLLLFPDFLGAMVKTHLYDEHVKLNAKIVDFHGWDMPIQYSNIIEEHTAVRTKVGLFDLSHMGRLWVRGKDRKSWLDRVLTIDIPKMAPGRVRYTFLLTEKGTVIDDLLVYEDAENDASFLVVNASNREKNLEWLNKQVGSAKVKIEDTTLKTSLVAVQGPKSVDAVKLALDIDPSALKYYTFGRFTVLGAKDCVVSRTGYTGEDGFEVFVPNDIASKTWTAFLGVAKKTGLKPVGLGARDTLRTEAGMPLYGQEIDDATTPVEAGLDFALALDKPGFIGQPVLKEQKAKGVAKKLTGFKMAGRRISRHGMDVYAGGSKTGVVTSGTFSPSLDASIGMAHVAPQFAAPGTAIEIDVRGKRESATTVAIPFYKRARS